jgi:hypothetical protein
MDERMTPEPLKLVEEAWMTYPADPPDGIDQEKEVLDCKTLTKEIEPGTLARV